MHTLSFVSGALLVIIILQNAFETIVLPRRVAHPFSLSRLFYRSSWGLWATLGRRLRPSNRRELLLSYFGPLSLIVLLVLWAFGLVLAFALLHWGAGVQLRAPEARPSFETYIYFSGTTFITLGLGDVLPLDGWGRTLVVLEASTGFGFLALIIGYVPVIYQAFSRREVEIALLDARASSPPSAVELLRRQAGDQASAELGASLRAWERWSAEVLESQLSYPVLSYYRSQHKHQSWIATLTMILDTCALLLVGIEGLDVPTARFTFAIARHAAVDLAQVLRATPLLTSDRLSAAEFKRLCIALGEVGLRFRDEAGAEHRLAEIRAIYEPFVVAMGEHLLTGLPPWVRAQPLVDDWQTSAWDHFAQWTPAQFAEITQNVAGKIPLRMGSPVRRDGAEATQPAE